MSTTDPTLDDRAETLAEQFDDHLDTSAGAILAMLRTVIDEFQLPADEAQRTVRASLADEAGIAQSELYDGNTVVGAGDINEDELWVDLEVTVVSLWDASDSMAQQGLVGDETGTIRFVAWDDAGLPLLEEGQSVRLTNVVTSEYQGDYSVKCTSATGIDVLERDIDVDDSERVSGVLVGIQDGSGLIRRCDTDDCTRVLTNGRCSDHGDQDGEWDLRIKAIVNDGETSQLALFDAEATEALTGIGLSEATQIAQDALDAEAVVERFEAQLGKRLQLTGPAFDDLLLVETIEQADPPTARAVLAEGRRLDVPALGV